MDIEKITTNEINKISDLGLRNGISEKLITPYLERRKFGYVIKQSEEGFYTTEEASDETFEVWIVGKFETGVGFAFSDEVWGRMSNSKWGIVMIDSDEFGIADNWYDSLEELCVDSGLLNQE